LLESKFEQESFDCEGPHNEVQSITNSFKYLTEEHIQFEEEKVNENISIQSSKLKSK